MSSILLLLDHRENQRLLEQHLGDRYRVIIPEGDRALAVPFDLGIVDGPALERLSEEVAARKADESPLFLPFLFVSSRHDVGLITRHLWRVVDELIISPIERVELTVRVEILLRARNYTLELEQARRELGSERAFFLSIFDLLPLPIVLLAPDRQELRTNQAFQQLWQQRGLRSWSDLGILTPDTRMPVPDAERPATKALHGEVVSGREYVIVAPDGMELPMLVHAAPIYIEGELRAAAVAMQDISSLKSADRAKDQFLAIISHELLSPVTSILGWERVAETSPEAVPQALEVIKRSAERQQRLVEDLLDVSRMIHGRFAVRPIPGELWELAVQCLEDIAMVAAERHVTLERISPGSPLPVMVDASRMRQAISNLLNNALKFTERGGTVTIEGRREGDTALLVVRDTGRGIGPDQLPVLFEPFRQAGEPGEGMGLGLALVRGIVEAHGGRVSASSAGLGRGSTFTIALPLRREAGEQLAAATPTEQAGV